MADIIAVETPRERPTDHEDCVDGQTFYGTLMRYFDVGSIRYNTIRREDDSCVIVREELP